MKSVVRAFPFVVDFFDEIEVWSCDCEIQHPKLNWQKIHAPKLWPLRMLWCIAVAHFRALWRFVILRQPKPDIIQCTDYFALFSNIIYVHFHYARFKEIIKSKPGLIALSKSKFFLFIISSLLERACFCWAKPKVWLTVSDSMALGLTKNERLAPVHVLPNAYCPQRFNPETRIKHRSKVREDLRIADEEIVLGFSALGNLQRKGLSLLLESAQNLRKLNMPIRLLLVGPTRKQLLAEISWNDNLYPIDDIITTGHVVETEKYFSAMDAFVFPSYCESFCLVLMEASAMGIPVFPTAFDGHEMTLIDGCNGALIPWCSRGISDVLQKNLSMILKNQLPCTLSKGITDNEFGAQLIAIYRKIIQNNSIR
jgi:glycosyltransferase involved in cell wall biosynthesis